jgi:cytochrome bd ubiquinol oxidase subunit I
LLKTQDAMSPNLNIGMILVTLIGFTSIYAALMVADVYLLVKFAKAGISDAEAESVEPSFVEIY